MKKTAFILLSLGLLLTACQQKELGPAEAGGTGTVHVTVYAADPISVRSSSSSGGITNVSSDDYYQRYILAVYDENGTTKVAEAQTEVADEIGGAVTFALDLTAKTSYKFVVWADFVTDSSGDTDLHYDTSNFPDITYNSEDDFAINDESFDAYYASETQVVTGADLTLTLKRPFAKLRLVTTDWDADEAPNEISITYDSGRYTSFNALDGTVSSEGTDYEFSADLDDLTYTDENDAEHTLVVDYLFATDEESTVHISYTATKDGDELNSLVIGKDIPLQRNYLTTVTGNLLTSDDSFSFGVHIGDDFQKRITQQQSTLSISSGSGDQITYKGQSYYTIEVEHTTKVTPDFDDLDDAEWTWESSDDEIATVEAGTSEDVGKGIIEGVSTGFVTITATWEDTVNNIIYTASGTFCVINPELGGIYINETKTVTVSIDDSHLADFWSGPLGSEQTVTWELTGDSGVITITDGVISASNFGTTTIKGTSSVTDTEYIADGYDQSVEVTVKVVEGYYNDTFTTNTAKWALNTTHANAGATLTWYTSEIGENYWQVDITSASQADIGHLTTNSNNTYGSNGSHDVYLDPINYPIICIRLDDLNDKGYTGRQIILDTSGHFTDADNSNEWTEIKGGIGGSANTWIQKYSCSDGSAILVYNLTTQKFNTTDRLLPSLGTFTTFAIKYNLNTTASEESYRFFWFKTFADETALNSFLADWSAETGITY